MNLERISIKVVGRESVFMTLAKISDFSKLYTTILFDQDLTMQKINTGDSVLAFNFKNIEQFKGTRPFKTHNQDELLDLYKTYGTSFLYQTKLHSGDLVRYNGLKYVVLGIIVNTYAQWNMPTPLLFNPTNVNNDYKSLYGSRLTEEQINSKINDNFQAGKYDADMVIPLVDANDFSEYITIIEPRPTKEEVELMFDSINAEKDLTIKSQKDVFIDTMLRLRGNEINKIKEVNEDLFKGVQTLLLSVNKAVNEQIELLPEPAVEKPTRKPREKKVVEELVPVVEIDSDELPDFIPEMSFIKDLPEQLKKLVTFRNSEQKSSFEFDLKDTIQFAFNWDDTPEGVDFWSEINDKGDLREFKKLYGNKGEKVDDLIAVSEMPKEPEVIYQEVKRVDIILYPPEGGVLEIKTDGLYELFEVSRFILTKYKSSKRKFNFNLITYYASYTTELYFGGEDSPDELLRSLIEKYDKFGYFKWIYFEERQADIDKIKLNEEIIDDGFKPELKPVEVAKPKPVEVAKPKPVPVEKPKPVVVKKPKPVVVKKPKPIVVEKPKPVVVEKPKPAKVVAPKVTKPKATKPKVEDDLSFLDDLDNIF
jgi:hypothetical protein